MKKMLCLLLTIAILFSLCGSTAFAKTRFVSDSDLTIHENYYPEDYIGYTYPVLPGTKEWQALEDHQQMIDACQIPIDVYQNMTTEELAQTMLAYPLNADMFAFDSYEMGFEVVKERFDGLQEFSNRADSASYLIDLYSEQELIKDSDLDGVTLRAFESDDSIVSTEVGKKVCKRIFSALTLSLFLSQNEFLEKMTSLDVLEFAKVIRDRHEAMSQEYVYTPDLYLLANELKQNETETEFEVPLKAGPTPLYIEFYDKISTGTTTVQTPKNASVAVNIMDAIEVWRYSDGNLYIGSQISDFPSSYKTTLNTEYYGIYGINPISGSGPTVKYNCHSYAWYNQSNPNYWMDNSKVSTARTGYATASLTSILVGGRMVYGASEHSAIVTSIYPPPGTQGPIMLTLKSKWGMAGLYQHAMNNCPYYPASSYSYYNT